jgi:hypothetical protein
MERFFRRNHMLLDNPDDRRPHYQHAGAVLSQCHGQVKTGKAEINRVATECEHALGQQRLSGPVWQQGSLGAAQLYYGSDNKADTNQRQHQSDPLLAKKVHGREIQGTVQPVSHQQATEKQRRGWHHYFGVFKRHEVSFHGMSLVVQGWVEIVSGPVRLNHGKIRGWVWA